MPAERPSTDALVALLKGHTDRREEQRILEILAACSPEELDALVASAHLAALLSSLDDRVVGPDNRAALMRLLLEQRIADLGVASRAALVRALQRGRTGSGDERHVSAILRATRGATLTALKEAIDGGTDYHDLVQLVHHDIDDTALRTALLQHIAAEAGAPSGLKVLSDIDDTFYANWKDKRYPAKTVYPGVRQLYAELAGASEDPRAAVVTFITARPGDRLGLVEDATRKTLAEHGLPRARVLAGAFTHLIGNDSIAAEKLANFDRYRGVFPEFRFVFLGDSGQGDVQFGEQMRAAAPASVPIVLIHDVVSTPQERRDRLRDGHVHLFDTYVGAASAAHGAGLVTDTGVRRVIDATRRELASVHFASEADRKARETELERDVARAC